MSTQKSESADASLYADETQRRKNPGFAELRRPGYLLKWLWSFIENWFMSRNYRQLAIGLPFVLIAFGGPMFVWWLKSAPRDGLVASYEAAVEDSIRKDEPEKTGVYLESLVRLRPLRKQFKHQAAMHYINQGQPERAGVHLNALLQGESYVPTSMWLLQQAGEPKPVFPLSEEDVDRHLDRVLEKQPTNPYANWQKSQRLMQTGQLKTAEDHLLKIVDTVPALGLPLAKVELQLERDKEQIRAHLDLADAYFQKVLMANGKDSESRVRRAEVLLLKGDLSGAAELIAEGRQLDDNDKLKAANAQVLVTQANQKLSASRLNAPTAAQDLQLAMQLNPSDPMLLRQALSLRAFGVRWNPDQLKPSLDALLQQSDLAAADQDLLLAGLAATGQNKKALEVISAVEQPEFADRLLEAELRLRDGQSDKADGLLKKLLADSEAADDLESSLNRAKVLLLLDRHADALQFIQECQQKFNDVPQQQVAAWQTCFGQANLAVFRERLTNDEFKSADEAIGMLTDPRQGPVNLIDVVRRMFALMNTRPDFAPKVRKKLIQLARTNRSGWQIYNMLGTYDLQLSEKDPGRLPDALKNLELAYQRQKNDPMLMNNLAIALVRNRKDLVKARELAESAISKLADPVDALSTRAEISVAEEGWDEALTDLEMALAQRPNSANVRRLLVKVLTAMGKPELAEEHQEVYDQLTAVTEK